LYLHEDAFVISANVNGVELHQILLDGGSSAGILFSQAFDEMELSRSLLFNTGTPLWGFDRGMVQTLGQITMSLSFGHKNYARTVDIIFNIVDTPYQYNTIFGKRLLNGFYVVLHHSFLCMKMPDPCGIVKVLGDQMVSHLIDLGRALGKREVNEFFQKHPRKTSPL
jgi:hypothetical protein